MVFAILLIGSLNLFNMVPRGKIEPAIIVGHTRIIPGNENYVKTHVTMDGTATPLALTLLALAPHTSHSLLALARHHIGNGDNTGRLLTLTLAF